MRGGGIRGDGTGAGWIEGRWRASADGAICRSSAEADELRHYCRGVFRVLHAEQLVCPEPDRLEPFGVGKNVEPVVSDGVKDRFSDLERRHAGVQSGLERGQTGLHFRGHRDRFVAQLIRPVAFGSGDIRPHQSGA